MRKTCRQRQPGLRIDIASTKTIYIILEKYANDRSGATWNKSVNDALGNLPVKVIQGTSDEGKGLIYHVTRGLNSHHSPDLFHVMYEISRGTAAPLSATVGTHFKESFGQIREATDSKIEFMCRRAQCSAIPARPRNKMKMASLYKQCFSCFFIENYSDLFPFSIFFS